MSYRIYFGPTSGVYTNSIAAGSATTLTVSNLVEGVVYYFAATALSTNGLESIFSNELNGTVNTPNHAPTLNSLANITINEDAGIQTVNLSGISSGATNEAQTLTVTASSSSPALIPNPTVAYTSPNATGSISFTPVASANGSATITVTVNDGAVTSNILSRSFTVTVNPVNDPPTISTITNRVIAVDTATGPIPFSIGDTDSSLSSLLLSARSDAQILVPNANIIFGGSNTNRTVNVTPASGQTGATLITIIVSDGTSTATNAFQLTVVPRPAAPENLRVALQ